jgi:hypothetical protein
LYCDVHRDSSPFQPRLPVATTRFGLDDTPLLSSLSPLPQLPLDLFPELQRTPQTGNTQNRTNQGSARTPNTNPGTLQRNNSTPILNNPFLDDDLPFIPPAQISINPDQDISIESPYNLNDDIFNELPVVNEPPELFNENVSINESESISEPARPINEPEPINEPAIFNNPVVQFVLRNEDDEETFDNDDLPSWNPLIPD